MPYSLVGGYTLPVRTALIETTDNTGTVDIVATGLLNGNAVVHEEAIVEFLEGQVMPLKLFLDGDCVVDPCAAAPTKTCTANEHSELFSRPPTASATRAPFAVVPIVVILVPLPAAGGPLVAAARVQVAPVRPDVTVVPPAVVAAVPDVAPTLHHALFARGRRLVAPGVNDQHCCLRRWSRQRRNSQARKRQPCQSQFPIRHGVLSFAAPQGATKLVGASLDERAVIVRDHIDLQHLPGQQRDRSEFERLRPSALSASGAFNQDGGATHSV
jgi:hypothetical protein